MDKSKFKKLALLGMAGGLLLATESVVQADEYVMTEQSHYLARSCGSKCSSPSNKFNSDVDLSKDNDDTADASDTEDESKSMAQQQATQPQQQQWTKGTPNPMTERELIGKLSPDAKSLYWGLDPEGKAVALKFVNEGSYNNVNKAVEAAARHAAAKREWMKRVNKQ